LCFADEVGKTQQRDRDMGCAAGTFLLLAAATMTRYLKGIAGAPAERYCAQGMQEHIVPAYPVQKCPRQSPHFLLPKSFTLALC
jgi:hypothetical protein